MSGRDEAPTPTIDHYWHDLGHTLIDLGHGLITGRHVDRPDRIANRLHRIAGHVCVRAARDGWVWGAYRATPTDPGRWRPPPLDADLEDACAAWADALAAIPWDPRPWAQRTARAVLEAVADTRNPARPFHPVAA